MDEEEIDFKICFPNLIIFLGPKKKEALFKELERSFKEFKYGTLYTHYEHRNVGGHSVSICRIMQQDCLTTRCLAVGQGTLSCDAKEQALEKLMKKLCDYCYVIKANENYVATSKKMRSDTFCNGDPSLRHIYKIVFLKNNSRGIPFPDRLSVSGMIDYVENYKELEEYIEAHGKSDSKADLFILGVLKEDRQLIREVCLKNRLNMQNLVGCSDMGLFAFRNMSTREILQDLLEAGGETIKYKLIGPQNHQFVDSNIKVNKEEFSAQSEGASEVEEEIVISPWIADRLIITEIVTERNELENPKEILFISVKNCPDTEEFIIEKRRNKVKMLVAEAMIDRSVVGRARGFSIKGVKRAAAEDAMQNLKTCCYYIEAKKSYFGSSHIVPDFLKYPNPASVTKTYRIATNTNTSFDRILKDFSSAPQEDLFFLQNFTVKERNRIYNLAKIKRFPVRWIGKENILCVYKRRNPRDIVKELMCTFLKENEKYKLIIPPNQLTKPTSLSDQHFGGRATEKELDVKPSGTPQHQPPHSVSQETKPSEQEGTNIVEPEFDPPSWVMKFIQSAPEKKVNTYAHKNKHPKPIHNPKKGSEDIYNKFKFVPPKYTPPPNSISMDFQGDEQRPYQSFKGADTEPYKPTAQHNFTHNEPFNKTVEQKPPTISERLEKILSNKNQTNLEEYNHIPSNSGFHQQSGGTFDNVRENTSQEQRNISAHHTKSVTDNRGNKRRYDIKEECESRNKFSKFTANPRISEFENSYERQIWEREKRSSEEFTESSVFATPLNTLQHRNPYDERLSTKLAEDYCRDTSQIFDRRPESTHTNPYDERSRIKLEGEYCRDTSQIFDRRPESTHTNPYDERPRKTEEEYCRDTSQIFDMRPESTHTNPYHERSRIKLEDEDYRGTSQIFEKRPEYTHSNPYEERSRIKLEEEDYRDTSQYFDMKPESIQNQSNSHLWDRSIEKDYDQRTNMSTGGQKNFSHLFDGVGSQGPSRPSFCHEPPAPWKTKPFKKRGHNFGKLRKYCKKLPHPY